MTDLDWAAAMRSGVIPDFPERGLYRQWDAHWNPTGYGPEPHHKGQLATRFPPHWTPAQCFLASKLKDQTDD